MLGKREHKDSSHPNSTSLQSTSAPENSVSTPQKINRKAQFILVAITIFTGLISVASALICPLLPVKTHTETIQWPRYGSNSHAGYNPSIIAPLSTLTPQNLSIDFPVRCALSLDQGVVISTIPANSPLFKNFGLAVMADSDSYTVSSRGTLILEIPRAQLAKHPASVLHIDTYSGSVYAELTQSSYNSTTYSQAKGQKIGPELKPQVSGIFTDVPTSNTLGAKATISIDNRFDTHATLIKKLAFLTSILSGLICLFSLFRFEKTLATTVSIRSQLGKFRLISLDIAVILTLLLWDILGAHSAGDGVIYNEAINAGATGSAVEYYRFFGISLAPYDWYPSLLGSITTISHNPLFLTLPTLIAGIITWLLISRAAIPLLNPQREQTQPSRLALIATAAIFLALWLPLNSGMRPEAFIALGSVLTWILCEYAFLSKRLSYLCCAVVIASFTLLLGVNGLISIAVMLACLPGSIALLKTIFSHFTKPLWGWLFIAIPILSSCAFTLVQIFRNNTLATVAEAIRVKLNIGPVTSWTQAYLRYYFLAEGEDGTLAIRLPISIAIMSLIISFFLLLRRKNITSIQPAIAMRIVSIILLTSLLSIFAPNKWVIEFGALTAFTTLITYIAAGLIITPTSHATRNYWLFIAILVFTLGYASAAKNSWPNFANLGIAWNDIKPTLAGKQLVTIGFYLAILCAGIALFFHYRDTLQQPKAQTPSQKYIQRILTPLAVATVLIVLLDVGTFAKGALTRRHSFTLASSNIHSLLGSGCALGNKIMVESNPSSDFLTPANQESASAALAGHDPRNTGFSPDGVPVTIADKPKVVSQGHIYTAVKGQSIYFERGQYPRTDGGSGPARVNGSPTSLPFGLDNPNIPVLGSYQYNATAVLTTDWYSLPQYTPDRSFIATTMAGSIQSWDRYGNSNYGQSVVFEFGVPEGDHIHVIATKPPIDAATGMAWRDIRVSRQGVENATVMRIVINDTRIVDDQWVATTPPRLPVLTTMDSYIGKTTPVLKDLAIADEFPCLRSATINRGLWEIPQWRVSPNRPEMDATSQTWQKPEDGGPLAITQALTSANTVPTFMYNDLYSDWGALIKLTPLVSVPLAHVESENSIQWGWHRSGPVRAFGGNDETTG